MIKFKILQNDNPALIGFAKAQAKRLIGMIGVIANNFARELKVGSNTVKLRGIRSGADYIVRVWITGEAASFTAIAYPMTKTGFTTTPWYMSSTPFQVSGLGPGGLGSIRAEESYVTLTAISFPTDTVGTAVTPVLDSTVHPRCVISVTRFSEFSRLTSLGTSRETINRLFDHGHGNALASMATRIFTTKTPADQADVMNVYVDFTWTPVYFWKEGDDVWALCRCVELDADPYSSGTLGADLIPCTGNYNQDRFPDYAAFLTYLSDRATYTPVENEPPATAWLQLPFIFMRAKVVDLVSRGGFHDPRSVDSAISGFVSFSVFGTTFSVPLTDITADGEWNMSFTYITGVFEYTVRFIGRRFLKNGVTPWFTGTMAVESFKVERDVWSSPVVTPDIADYTSTVERAQTTGTPFESYDFVDMRRQIDAADYYKLSARGYVIVSVDRSDPSVTVQRFRWTSLWSSYFNGVCFRTYEIGNYIDPASPLSNFTRIYYSTWGNFNGRTVSSSSGVERIRFDQNGMTYSNFVETSSYKLVRESMGVKVELGDLNIDYVPTSSSMSASNFVPTTQMQALGLTEYRMWSALAPYAVYEGRLHYRSGYYEVRPILWAENAPMDVFYGIQGRYYKGQVVDTPTLREGNPTSYGLYGRHPSVMMENELLTLLGGGGMITRNIEIASNRLDISEPPSSFGNFWPDTIDYPAPFPYYPSEADGGVVVGSTRVSLSVIAIYYPYLTPTVDGFCMLKLMPAASIAKVIYFHGQYNDEGLPAIKQHADVLNSYTTHALMNPYSAYKAAISTFAASVNTVYAKLGTTSPPTVSDYTNLQALALSLVRQSYEVMANNFAPPELMDLFDTSVILIPPVGDG